MKNKKIIAIIILIIVVIIAIIGGIIVHSNYQSKQTQVKSISKEVTNKETANKEVTASNENFENKKYLDYSELKQYISNQCYDFFIKKYGNKVNNKEMLKKQINDYIEANITEKVVHTELALKGDSFDKNQISVDYNQIEPAGTFVLKVSNFIPGEDGYVMIFRNFISKQ